MSKLILRDYQEEAIQTILETFEHRSKQMCVLPTGSGKTVVFANVIEKLKCRTLIIAHTRELLLQAQATIEHICPSMSINLYDASHRS